MAATTCNFFQTQDQDGKCVTKWSTVLGTAAGVALLVWSVEKSMHSGKK